MATAISSERRKRIREALLSFAKSKFENSQHSSQSTHKLKEEDHSPEKKSLSLSLSERYQQESIIAAPISPTPPDIIRLVLHKLNLKNFSSQCKSHHCSSLVPFPAPPLVVDLGCGDGRWIFPIAKTYECRCIGYDIDEQRLQLARKELNKLKEQQQNQKDYLNRITLLKRNVFEVIEESDSPVFDADVLILYLFRDAMKKISNALKRRGVVPIMRSQNSDVSHDKLGESFTQGRNILQIVSVGFALPFFAPFWQDCIGGVRIYLYHAKRQ